MSDLRGSPYLSQRPVAAVQIGNVTLQAGDQVRLRPGPGGDIMDIALAGKLATIQSIEQELESGVYLAVVLEDDPGRDLGLQRQPGHRFFFRPDEVEPFEPDKG